jgi:hypothetical protein
MLTVVVCSSSFWVVCARNYARLLTASMVGDVLDDRGPAMTRTRQVRRAVSVSVSVELRCALSVTMS